MLHDLELYRLLAIVFLHMTGLLKPKNSLEKLTTFFMHDSCCVLFSRDFSSPAVAVFIFFFSQNQFLGEVDLKLPNRGVVLEKKSGAHLSPLL